MPIVPNRKRKNRKDKKKEAVCRYGTKPKDNGKRQDFYWQFPRGSLRIVDWLWFFLIRILTRYYLISWLYCMDVRQSAIEESFSWKAFSCRTLAFCPHIFGRPDYSVKLCKWMGCFACKMRRLRNMPTVIDADWVVPRLRNVRYRLPFMTQISID